MLLGIYLWYIVFRIALARALRCVVLALGGGIHGSGSAILDSLARAKPEEIVAKHFC